MNMLHADGCRCAACITRENRHARTTDAAAPVAPAKDSGAVQLLLSDLDKLGGYAASIDGVPRTEKQEGWNECYAEVCAAMDRFDAATSPAQSPDTRCAACLGSEFPGWKRGIRCAKCDGTATVEPAQSAVAPVPPSDTFEYRLQEAKKTLAKPSALDTQMVSRRFLKELIAALSSPTKPPVPPAGAGSA